jgi:hypothetical protein
MKRAILKYMAGFALLLQISFLIYSILYLRGSVEEDVHIVFLRITLLIGSAMMVILTRYFLRFIGIARDSIGTFLVQVISLLPTIIIPVGGFIFAYRAKSGGDYLLFFVIGLYHLIRYYPVLIKM